MSHNPGRRSVVIGATLLLLAACRGDTTSPDESTDAGGTRSAGQTPATAPADTAGSGGTAPATPAPGPSSDTARAATPGPAPASAIELGVYVGLASPGADTLRSTPVANARVAVLSRTFTRSTGPDTVTETPVASSTTDALGKVSFGNLPAVGYRIEAVVDGRSGPPTSIQIAPPYPSKVATSIILRPAP